MDGWKWMVGGKRRGEMADHGCKREVIAIISRATPQRGLVSADFPRSFQNRVPQPIRRLGAELRGPRTLHPLAHCGSII